jgi:hypothetical protein
MAQRNRNTRTSGALATRVVYLPDQLTPREPVYYTPAQRVAKCQRDREAYQAWKLRQLDLAERDRRMRRLFLGAGLVVGIGLLGGVSLAGWWLWHSITTATFHLDPGVAVGVLFLLVVGAKIGHRCVTTITHSH